MGVLRLRGSFFVVEAFRNFETLDIGAKIQFFITLNIEMEKWL